MTTGDVVYSLRISLIKILPEPGFDLGSRVGESRVLTAKLHIVPLKQILPNSFFGCFELGIISESKFKGASTCGIAEVKSHLQIV